MSSRVSHLFIVVLTLCLVSSGPAAEFHPGWIYVSASAAKGLNGGDLIWAFNPADGQSELVGDIGLAGTNDLVFSADGARLLNAMWGDSSVGAISPEGDLEIYLEPRDGIFHPYAITYDRQQNFYVLNSDLTVRRFPAGGGPGEVFADNADGITGWGSVTLSPQGELYYAQMENKHDHQGHARRGR